MKKEAGFGLPLFIWLETPRVSVILPKLEVLHEFYAPLVIT